MRRRVEPGGGCGWSPPTLGALVRRRAEVVATLRTEADGAAVSTQGETEKPQRRENQAQGERVVQRQRECGVGHPGPHKVPHIDAGEIESNLTRGRGDDAASV